MPKVSIIIPCYNLGKYLPEAVDSVKNQTFQGFEIIIVNDGSTDEETIKILGSLENLQVKVIHTNNQGLANARNNGIAEAAGEYILPLDADDKIAPTYLEKAVKVLDEDKNIGIVYCLAEFFDKENSQWDLPEYNLSRILIDNLIFCSAFFRKEDWKLVGGYKSSMKYGWEDYEFWLSILELKRDVCRIPEHLFYYRQRSNSMANVMSREHLYYSYKELVKNHKDLYLDNIESIFEYIYFLRDTVSEKKEEIIAKDTHIHNLNLKISDLNSEKFHLNSQLSSVKVLTDLLIKLIVKKIRKSLRL